MAHGGPLSLSTTRKILGPQGPQSLGAPGVPGALGAQGPWGEKEKSAPLIPTTLAFSRTKKKSRKTIEIEKFSRYFQKNVVFITSPTRHTYVHPSIRPSIPRYKKFRKLKIADF